MQTRNVYEFLGYYYHGCTCQPFRDVKTIGGETLAERYKHSLSRIEQIKWAGYQVKIQWECQFDEAGIVEQKYELLCMGVEPKPCGSTIRYGRGRNLSVQYCDVISLYPYI